MDTKTRKRLFKKGKSVNFSDKTHQWYHVYKLKIDIHNKQDKKTNNSPQHTTQWIHNCATLSKHLKRDANLQYMSMSKTVLSSYNVNPFHHALEKTCFIKCTLKHKFFII